MLHCKVKPVTGQQMLAEDWLLPDGSGGWYTPKAYPRESDIRRSFVCPDCGRQLGARSSDFIIQEERDGSPKG